MKLVVQIIKILPEGPVYAHCDIPCGIYDPTPAQIAAHTVLRMTQLLTEIKIPDEDDVDAIEYTKHHNSVARMIVVKEDHAEIVKHDVGVIWGDYFKEENVKGTPELHAKVFKIMKLASKTKQEVNIDAANELIVAVQEFSEIFYKSKDLEVIKIPSGYPTGGEIISHK